MKNILTILFIGIITVSASGQYAVDNIFRKYKNDSGVISWLFKGDISSFLNRVDDIEIKSTLKDIDVIMFSKGQDISDKDKKKLKIKVKKDNYELLFQARDKKQNMVLMGIQEEKIIKKVFAQIMIKDMTGYFFLNGDIYLEDLQHIDFKKMMKGLLID